MKNGQNPFRPDGMRKIEVEGDLCYRCHTPIEKKERTKTRSAGASGFVNAWYFVCPKCFTIYSDAKSRMSSEEFFGKAGGPGRVKDCPGQLDLFENSC